ncbi:MAG: SDR family NAD(P)-dependent oxidoreductase [Crocinitomicaceae bacterium]|nr:SDR family NAD(P)-dependent oxidoreductase [Flavobacteriales bacterium]NQZ36404.1 SDR family NAD(P)-dependent oxidoreductase [Crocinitomicaceae bacterium]
MILSKNKILITGGNKGIGLALAKKFLSLDNDVIITGRNKTDLAKVKEQFPAVFTFQCDLSDMADLDKLSLYIENEHSDLNVLINNAGIQYNYTFPEEKQLVAKIDYETKVNFLAPVKLAVLLLPIISLNTNSAIVNVSSALGIVPKVNASIYCANKAGIHSFSQTLRMQLSKTKVFEILPSLVDTAMTKGRGTGKISPETLVEEFITSFKKNRYETNIGKVKMLRFLHRISPALASKIINK